MTLRVFVVQSLVVIPDALMQLSSFEGWEAIPGEGVRVCIMFRCPRSMALSHAR